MTEQERWRVLREDEDYGPGCYEVGLTAVGYGPHPPPPEGDSILVAESRVQELEGELAEVRRSREAIHKDRMRIADEQRLRAEAAKSRLVRLEEAARKLVEAVAANEAASKDAQADRERWSDSHGAMWIAADEVRSLLTHSTPPSEDQ